MKSKVSEKLLSEVGEYVIKQRDYKDYIIASAFLLVGIVLTIALMKIDFGTDSPVFFTLWLVVCVAVATGVIKICGAKCRYFVKDSKQPLSQNVLYFEGLSPEELIGILKGNNYGVLNKYFRKDEKGLKVELLATDDGSFSRCLIFKFIPYNYEAVSDVIALSSEQVSKLLSIGSK